MTLRASADRNVLIAHSAARSERGSWAAAAGPLRRETRASSPAGRSVGQHQRRKMRPPKRQPLKRGQLQSTTCPRMLIELAEEIAAACEGLRSRFDHLLSEGNRKSPRDYAAHLGPIRTSDRGCEEPRPCGSREPLELAWGFHASPRSRCRAGDRASIGCWERSSPKPLSIGRKTRDLPSYAGGAYSLGEVTSGVGRR